MIFIFFKSNLIAGTSFDFACRLWSLNDTRLKMASGDVQPTVSIINKPG